MFAKYFLTGVGEIAYARGGRGFRAALRSVKPSAIGKNIEIMRIYFL